MGYRDLILPRGMCLIDQTKAINIDSNRSATEHKDGSADVIGLGSAWFHARMVRTAGGAFGVSFNDFGDTRSNYPTTGFQIEVFKNGSLYVTADSEQFTVFFDFTPFGTACRSYPTPNGSTIIDYDLTSGGPAWINPATDVITMRFVSSTDPGDVRRVLDPMNLCFTEPIVDGADWEAQ